MERQYKILIVDDERGYLNNLTSDFVDEGYLVETAADGEAGREKLATNEFDVAIIDIRMPKMNGIELARYAYKESIDTEIIILTGHGERDEAVEAIKAHVGDWFDKSGIEMSKLLARVKELADGPPIEEIRRFLSVIPEEQSHE